MDFAVTFARHFARLVWLIRSAPASVDDQKGALRAIVTVVKEGAVTLRPEGGRLLANGTPLPDILTGVKEVTGALGGTVAYSLTFDQGASPGDILGIARFIATDSPDPLVSRVAHLAPKTARMDSVADDATPARARETATLTAELVAEIEADKERAAAAAAAAAAPPVEEAPIKGVTGDATIDRLLWRLSHLQDPKAAGPILEELAGRVDVFAREGNLSLVVRAINAMVERERPLSDQDMRRVYVVALRRVFRPQVLRIVVPGARHDPALREMLVRILERAGEDGALVVFEEVLRAPTVVDHDDLVTLLRSLSSSLATLLRLLGDPNRFIVRAAVDLLGEIGAPETERAIADLLRHADDRVRRSAAAAISRFDTPFAVDALYRALSDSTAAVRLQAVHGLTARKGNPKVASIVVGAIDSEPEVEVQLAQIAALGRFGTPDSVAKLSRAAADDGRIFRRKNAAYRVAAVQALAETRTAAALSALRALANDREKDVRDAAARAISVR